MGTMIKTGSDELLVTSLKVWGKKITGLCQPAINPRPIVRPQGTLRQGLRRALSPAAEGNYLKEAQDLIVRLAELQKRENSPENSPLSKSEP